MSVATFMVAFIVTVVAKTVEIKGRVMYVDGEPFIVQGMCYSPVPIGESPMWQYGPHGDYFTEDFAYIWRRDLPLLKAMGVNTVRIYGWANSENHTEFLDELARANMYAYLTYYVPTGDDLDYANPERVASLVTNFTNQVEQYGEHDAILAWSFGNELNGPWNQLFRAYNEKKNCGWSYNCWNGNRQLDPTCRKACDCVYEQLFEMINDACGNATKNVNRPCSSAMADVDFLVDDRVDWSRVSWYQQYTPNVAFWAMQLYRGYTFGNYFVDFEAATADFPKPMLVTEYGVDAFNDPCGWNENKATQWTCFNLPDNTEQGGPKNHAGYVGCKTSTKLLNCTIPGEDGQVMYDVQNTREIYEHTPNPKTGKGAALGGFLMAWQDEFWKGYDAAKKCYGGGCDPNHVDQCNRADYAQGGSKGCMQWAHWTCPNGNASFQGLCGYDAGAMPDGYLNEEWFGMTQPVACGYTDIDGGHHADTLTLRPVYYAIQELWTGKRSDTTPISCEALKPCYDCVAAHKDISNVLHTVCAVQCGNTPSPTTTMPTPAPTPPAPIDQDIEISVRILMPKTDFDLVQAPFFSQLAQALNLNATRIDQFHVATTSVEGNSGETEIDFMIKKAQQYNDGLASVAVEDLKSQMAKVVSGDNNVELMKHPLTSSLDMAYGVHQITVPTQAPPGGASKTWIYGLVGGIGGVALVIGLCMCCRGKKEHSRSKGDDAQSSLLGEMSEGGSVQD